MLIIDLDMHEDLYNYYRKQYSAKPILVRERHLAISAWMQAAAACVVPSNC